MFYGAYPFGLLFPVPAGALFLSVFSKQQSFRHDYINSSNSPVGRSMFQTTAEREQLYRKLKVSPVHP